MVLLLDGAIHIFSASPEWVASKFSREYTKSGQRLATIIQYPYAVSCFCQLDLSYEYLAQVYSKKMASLALVTIAGVRDGLYPREQQALQMYWGIDNKCVMRNSIEANMSGVTFENHGLDDFKKYKDTPIDYTSVIYQDWSNKVPIDIMETLETELGVFIGGRELSTVLKSCIFAREKNGVRYVTVKNRQLCLCGSWRFCQQVRKLYQ